VTTRRAAKRRPVVLYQPAEEGHAMPLGLLALGSWLAGEHVVIVDGRFELAPEARVVELIRDALCLGVSVRTSPSLREALRVSGAARAASPDLAVVWGGAHATLDPASCLATGVVDACAVGAGEEAITAAVTARRAGRPLARQAGLVLAGDAAGAGPPVEAPTTLWPRADYSLLDVERHFDARGARRLDYCSSRGARDGATWLAIRAERVVAETSELAERYGLAEVVFRDEDFFADPERVDTIARGLLEGGAAVGWQAAARAADVVAAGAERLRLLRESGCGRLLVTLLPGETARERVLEAGARLHEAGLAARFVFEVGSPGAGAFGLDVAVAAARALSALDGRFETPIRRSRAVAPAPPGRSLEAWAAEAGAAWPDSRAERRFARTAFYFAEAQRPPGRRLGQHVARLLALVRVRLGFFALDLDRRAVEASTVLRTGRRRRDALAD
jgi:hypothetical protein